MKSFFTIIILIFCIVSLKSEIIFSVELPFNKGFTIKTFETSGDNELMTETGYLLANIYLYKDKNLTKGVWEHIGIFPDDYNKDTILKIERFNISNIQNYKEAVEFDVDLGTSIAAPNFRKIHIVIKQDKTSKYDVVYELVGKGIFWSTSLRKTFTKIWKSQKNRYVKLKYPNVM